MLTSLPERKESCKQNYKIGFGTVFALQTESAQDGVHDAGNRSVTLDIKCQTSIFLFRLKELNFLKIFGCPSYNAFTQEEQQHFDQQFDIYCRPPNYATHFAKTKLIIGSVATRENNRLDKTTKEQEQNGNNQKETRNNSTIIIQSVSNKI